MTGEINHTSLTEWVYEPGDGYMVLGLIRHGETDWNRERRIQGQRDIPLNDEGRRQAQSLALHLDSDDVGWNALYSSELARARETAKIVGYRLGLPVTVDKRLRERDFGLLEGSTPFQREEWRETPRWQELDCSVECVELLDSRVNQFISSLPQLHSEDDRVLVVTHGGVIGCVLRSLVPSTEIGEIRNASVSTLRYQNGVFECESFGSAYHLLDSDSQGQVGESTP